MIFFVAMPFVTGFMNYVVPLQIGARDVAFPFLNNFSFWMTAGGAILSPDRLAGLPAAVGHPGEPGRGGGLLLVGASDRGGGHHTLRHQPDRDHHQDARTRHDHDEDARLHVDLAVHQRADRRHLPGAGRHAGAADGDRYLGTNFFTNDLGGNAMLYVNLIWIWGHPEVYILVLPVFGIFSEPQEAVRLRVHGLRHGRDHDPVLPRLAAPLLHDGVWREREQLLRHHDDDHLDPDGRQDLQLAVHDVPRPIKFEVPMLWTVGFMVTFTIGGMTGVLLAVPAADFVLHNSLFLIAHFHNVIIGGVVFGAFAGINYWFPKAFGFRLDAFWGKVSFWCWFIGFWVAFTPLYVLGLMGVTRRVSHFDDMTLQPYFQVAAVGAGIIALGIGAFLVQIAVSIWRRKELADTTGDIWGGRTLEWSTSSPPPDYNFAFTPIATKWTPGTT
ncbi:hypothetical protein Lal_00005359 [Lupinus albus]|nr:hypothetical protein Lal_00005359 [Lupinus albus]